MVLAGIVIALGVIVDDAIIDVQNIVRRLRQRRREGSDEPTAKIVLDASLEMRGPIVYATLIVVLAIVPVFFLEGLTGAFFQPLATSYALAVLVSLLVALTVTPAMSMILLRKAPLERRESPIARWLEGGYERLLERIIRKPLKSYIAVGAVVAAGAAVVPFLGQALLPDFKERDFLMHWLTQPSTSQARGDAGLGPGLSGASHDPGRSQLRVAYRPGAAVRRGRRHLLRRELDQRRSRPSTTTRRSRRSTRSSLATPVSTETCRPI